MAGIRDSMFDISFGGVRSVITASLESSPLNPFYCQKRLDLGEKLFALCHSCKDTKGEHLSAMMRECRKIPIGKINTFIYARVSDIDVTLCVELIGAQQIFNNSPTRSEENWMALIFRSLSIHTAGEAPFVIPRGGNSNGGPDMLILYRYADANERNGYMMQEESLIQSQLDVSPLIGN
ncbi:hypothetical protein BO83DRAFT_384262 [Aspergillus eucalypticola CBS 122712]|uniref:Uncharacterized protein n=1 Tax=Aspergillus eucalypticola (strain CBS 122712 / IBT 29274) TaxID=1448314 RepID=A0A317WGE1_ASPEC|nr:uncharacterized protein BO83DRAFT_384262 [Aspergillus eucalypticola CBS 122712]PWY85536.1 hypothetical protein BO83DRAFT_384262 [Aspergillus eucalypticola CBS 122712]